jgi:hypothetical protein
LALTGPGEKPRPPESKVNTPKPIMKTADIAMLIGEKSGDDLRDGCFKYRSPVKRLYI